MKKKDKTNVMRLLDQAGITYTSHFCEEAEGLSGEEIAKVMGENPDQTFKTLVTVCAKTKEHFVFVVPVNKELNLKKAANSVRAKSIEMIKSKDLLPLTGYVHGGCSPIGLKKPFLVTIDSSAKNFSSLIFSGGKIGYQVEVDLKDLAKVIHYQFAEVTKDRKETNE